MTMAKNVWDDETDFATGKKAWNREWPSMDWVDQHGRRWSKLSAILERPELADPERRAAAGMPPAPENCDDEYWNARRELEAAKNETLKRAT
jgi:hypothetical protein